MLADLHIWDAATIQGVFGELQKEYQLALGKIAQPARVALTGGTVSPGIFEVMEALGKERTLVRLDRALALIGEAPA